MAKIPIDELIVFTRYLSLQLKSGNSLSDSLAVIARDTQSPVFKQLLENTQKNIENGQSFHQALAAQSVDFPRHFLYFIALGEKTNSLADILSILANSMKNLFSYQIKLKSSTWYIQFLFILIVILGVIVSIGEFFIFNIFKDMYTQMNMELPALTEMVLYSLPVLTLSTIILVPGFFLLLKVNPSFADRVALNFPFLGKLNRLRYFADLFSLFSLFAKIKIPIVEALNEMAPLIENQVFQAHIKALAHQIEGGTTFSAALKQQSFFPSSISTQLEKGELAGNFPEVLEQIAHQSTQDLEMFLSHQPYMQLLSLIGFLFLVLPVGLTVIAFYLPMFTLIGGIGG